MLPRPRPETIADAISMVVSGRRVAALFAHSRERGNPIFRCCPQKGDGSPLARACAGTSGR